MEGYLLSGKERLHLWLRLSIRLVLLVAALVLLRYAGPPLVSLLLPFVLALVVAWVLNPVVRWLQRRLSVSRKSISLILLVLLFGIIGGVLYLLARVAVSQVRSLFANWDSVTATLIGALNSVTGWLGQLGQFLPDFVETGEDLTQELVRWLQELDVSGWLTSLAGKAPSLVSDVSGFAVAAVVYLMASYFITSDYPRLRFLFTDHMPADLREFWGSVKGIFMSAFGGYLKSQLLLSLGVFGILAIGFMVVGQPYGLLLAAGLAVLDFIPIVGAGTILAPWAVVDLIVSNYVEAIQLLVIWGIIVLFRRLAEPKILGNQTGLDPILSLLGIYVGMRLGGVLGMIAGPIILLVILNLAKAGVFRPAANDLRLASRDVMSVLKAGRSKEQEP